MKLKRIVLILFSLFCLFPAFAQSDNGKLLVFTERDYCISGDTLHFSVWIPQSLAQKGNVVHFQMDGPNDNLIATVAVKSLNGIANGFIAVPDSLGTGVYFCSAFLNAQRAQTSIETVSKTLFVYNRFEELINRMEIPLEIKKSKTLLGDNGFDLQINRSEYKTRDEVKLNIQSNAENISYALVSVRAVDPFVKKHSGYVDFSQIDKKPGFSDFVEKDGILLTGNVRKENEMPAANELVLLSVSEVDGFFDYYYTNQKGDFGFFLQGAKGNANVILQSLPCGSTFNIDLNTKALQRADELQLDTVFLLPNEVDFIQNHLKGNFFTRLFSPSVIKINNQFNMPNPYGIPIYGSDHERIVPAEFFDLPDFQEISRELLHGVQYRVKEDEHTFRIVNYDQGVYFGSEPLRLLNGVPVFKNSHFSTLKSQDIEYIDVIKSERLYGDLIFNGVLAVSLYNKSNDWLAEQPNIFQFEVPCLQPPKLKTETPPASAPDNIPDTRMQYLWRELPIDHDLDVNFVLSDFVGEVEIVIEGVTTSGELFRTLKTFTVK